MKGRSLAIAIISGASIALLNDFLLVRYGIKQLGLPIISQYIATVLLFLIFASLFCVYQGGIWGGILSGVLTGIFYTFFSSVLSVVFNNPLCLKDFWVYGLIGGMIFFAVNYYNKEEDLESAVVYLFLMAVSLALLVFHKQEASVKCLSLNFYTKKANTLLKKLINFIR